jgi:HK97 family phage prohead protease
MSDKMTYDDVREREMLPPGWTRSRSAVSPIAEFRSGLTGSQRTALDAFERRFGTFGGTEKRYIPLSDSDIEVREGEQVGTNDLAYIVRGHASVFDRKSLDLGGFQEIIEAGAFKDALDRNPDVALVPDHDMTRVLARTNRSPYLLELREDPKGLHYYAKVIPTADALDLRLRMEAGLVDQSSFAFTVDEDSWEIKEKDGEETVVRTIHRVGDLFDVTITAFGAYPQTDSQVVRSYAEVYASAQGRSLETVEAVQDPEEVAPETEGTEVEDLSHDSVVGGDEKVKPVDTQQGRDAKFRMQQSIQRHRHELGVNGDGS